MDGQTGFSRMALAAGSFLLASLFVALDLAAGATEHGHVRARTRAFKDAGTGPGIALTAPHLRLPGLKLLQSFEWQWNREPTRSGYLAEGAPNILRFSDDDEANGRPPAPALPEFSMLSNEYVPYVLEEPLPQDALNDPSLLAEIVIDMEPHTVVSGVIDTRPTKSPEQMEQMELEQEKRSPIVRPEEVLIFFEADTRRKGEVKAIIPFSPAGPSETKVESSAEYIKE